MAGLHEKSHVSNPVSETEPLDMKESFLLRVFYETCRNENM